MQQNFYLFRFWLWLRYEEPFHISEPALFLSHTGFTVLENEEIQLSFLGVGKMIWSMQRKGMRENQFIEACMLIKYPTFSLGVILE